MLGIVLAAGAGRRLGGPKALLELAGATALERCVAALREGGVERVRVVVGARAEEVRARHAELAVEVVVNAAWERGQTSSIRAGLRALPDDAEAFALHTVDHPLVRAEHVARLLRAWRGRPAGCAVVAPSVDGRRGHPTLFARELAAEFLALDDEAPGHTVVRADPGRVHHVELDAPWLVRDLDTPEDLAAALTELG